MVIMNPRRGRARRKTTRRRKSRNMRLILKNPTASGTVSAVKRGFSFESVKTVLPIALGAVGNVYAQEFVASKLPAGFRGGWKDNVVGIVTAGGMLAISTALKQGALGQKLFIGGLTQVVIKSLLPYVVQFTGDPGTAFNRPIIATSAPATKALPAPNAEATASAASKQMAEFVLS